MNSAGKSLEDLSARHTKSCEEIDELDNYSPERTFTLKLLSRIDQPKKEILKKLPESTDIFPLSQGQQALWLLSQSNHKSTLNQIAMTFRIQSKVDITALRGAFQELIDRHPSLRTTFSIHNGRPFQEVHRNQQVCFEEIDASELTWEQLNNQIIISSQKSFNIEKGPLMRVSLFTHTQEEHILLINIYNIVFDAWSYLILLDELRILYSAQKAGTSAFLMPPIKTYADYVQWQAEMLSGFEGEQLWSYWSEKLAGDLPVANLPVDKPRPAVQSFRGAAYTFELNEELSEKVKHLSEVEGKTIYLTLLAAFYVLLFLYTGQKDILVGSLATGRSQPEFTRTIGNFMNQIVFRQSLSGDPTFRMFLTQVHKTVVNALKHQDYPFPMLVQRLCPDNNYSDSPLFQTMFHMAGLGEILDMLATGEKKFRMEWDDLELDLYKIYQQDGKFDLTLVITEVGRSLQGAFVYNENLFKKETIVQMAARFQTLLNSLIVNPNQRLSEIYLFKDI